MIEYLEILQNIVILLFSLVIHENAHARIAYFLGDPTSKYAGRFSLNPLDHIDLVGLILPLILALMHLPVIGAAKPVVVDISNFKHPRFYNILVALAGPLSNFLLATIAILLYNRLSFLPHGIFLSTNQFLINFTIINLLLFMFNLLPIPPLDGSRLYTSFISRENNQIIEWSGLILIIFLLGNTKFQEYFQSSLRYIMRMLEYISL